MLRRLRNKIYERVLIPMDKFAEKHDDFFEWFPFVFSVLALIISIVS